MRTIIVYDTGIKLYYHELSDIGRVPAYGGQVVLLGTRYSIAAEISSPSLYAADGTTKRTGFDKLVEILASMHGDATTVQSLVQSMESIGSADRPTMSGKILIPGKGVSDFDDLVYLRLKALPPVVADLSAVILKVHSLMAPSAPESDGTAAALSPITLGEEAASDGEATS